MITLILEPTDYSKKALALYRKLGPVCLYPNISLSQREKIIRTAEILVVRLGYKIDAAWLDRMPHLKIIATPTTGLNHIDCDAVAKRGVKIISLKGHVSFLKDIPSTAEETFALMLALVRNIPWAFDHVKKGGWNRDVFKGRQLLGKTLGLVGFGRLGKIVARYAKVFGKNVIAYDPYVKKNVFLRHGVARVSLLEELFKKADIISVHAALTDETKNLIQERHFKVAKPGAYLINTARGEIIDEAALLRALKDKRIAGAALDVLWNESGDGKHLKDNPLIDYARTNSNLLIVPHLGGATYEAMQVTEDFVANQVLKVLKK